MSARSWLQAPQVQPAACTVRLTLDPSGTPSTVDWSPVAGTRWASADAMLAEWNAALAGAGVVVTAVVSDERHRATVRVDTPGAVAYSVAWSHSGDGSRIRNRLGESANIVGRASGAAWTGPIAAAWYSWVGCRGLVRQSTTAVASSLATLDGTVETLTSADVHDETVALDLELRWGVPAGGDADAWYGHAALEAFLTSAWDFATDDVWALYHRADDANAAELWGIRLTDASPVVMPEQVAGSVPYSQWSVTLQVSAEVTP